MEVTGFLIPKLLTLHSILSPEKPTCYSEKAVLLTAANYPAGQAAASQGLSGEVESVEPFGGHYAKRWHGPRLGALGGAPCPKLAHVGNVDQTIL